MIACSLTQSAAQCRQQPAHRADRRAASPACHALQLLPLCHGVHRLGLTADELQRPQHDAQTAAMSQSAAGGARASAVRGSASSNASSGKSGCSTEREGR